jgi:hypothetical protein
LAQVYYTNGQTDEGAAFVYHGSASGISTTAARCGRKQSGLVHQYGLDLLAVQVM